MKILLLGKNGQVGSELQRTLLPFGAVVALSRSELDLNAPDGIPAVLEAHRPDLIVNAAAWTQVDRAEQEPEEAFRANAEAVAQMAGFAQKSGALLVHYSTDYVFDGSKAGAYVETDASSPLNVYGRSKREGELALEASGCEFLAFRTSWVFSSTGANFVRTVLRLARERPSLRIVADQFGAPTSAELIADVTALAIAAHRQGKLSGGLWHLTAGGRASWHDLACHVVRRARETGFDLQADESRIEPIATSDYPTPAARPRNSCLNIDAISVALGLQMPDWTAHVDRALTQLKNQGLHS